MTAHIDDLDYKYFIQCLRTDLMMIRLNHVVPHCQNVLTYSNQLFQKMMSFEEPDDIRKWIFYKKASVHISENQCQKGRPDLINIQSSVIRRDLQECQLEIYETFIKTLLRQIPYLEASHPIHFDKFHWSEFSKIGLEDLIDQVTIVLDILETNVHPIRENIKEKLETFLFLIKEIKKIMDENNLWPQEPLE